MLSPERRTLRARKGGKLRHDPCADVTELDREIRALGAEEYIRELVNAAPPLTAEQRARLAALLAPGTGEAA